MKGPKNWAIFLALWLWQLPQNLLGLLLLLYYRPEGSYDYRDVRLHYSTRMHGGISLGRHIIVSDRYRAYNGNTEKHEYGHTRQSRMLGPLYLIVIGIPSVLWAAWWQPGRGSYYRFWTERWADVLGGVER